MKKLLFIGDYFPHISFDSALNDRIGRELGKDFELILLSRGWCDVKDGIWGDVDSLSTKFPFIKKYYLDPIQLKYMGGDIVRGYLGLACKILETEKVDLIIYADKMQYCLLTELLKARYSIPIYRIIYDANVYQCLDDYTIPYILHNLKSCDKIYMYLPNIDLFNRFINTPQCLLLDINDIYQELYLPMNIQNIERVITLFVTIIDEEKYEILMQKMKGAFPGYELRIVFIKNNFQDGSYKQLESLNEFLIREKSSSMVIFENELLGQKHIAFSEIFLSLTWGLPCILEKDKIRQISQFYDVREWEINEEYGAISILQKRKAK